MHNRVFFANIAITNNYSILLLLTLLTCKAAMFVIPNSVLLEKKKNQLAWLNLFLFSRRLIDICNRSSCVCISSPSSVPIFPQECVSFLVFSVMCIRVFFFPDPSVKPCVYVLMCLLFYFDSLASCFQCVSFCFPHFSSHLICS